MVILHMSMLNCWMKIYALILERAKSTPAETQNQYQPGDLV